MIDESSYRGGGSCLVFVFSVINASSSTTSYTGRRKDMFVVVVVEGDGQELIPQD
jgi:hypothetical protein